MYVYIYIVYVYIYIYIYVYIVLYTCICICICTCTYCLYRYYIHRMQGGVSEFGFRRVVSRAAGSGKAALGTLGLWAFDGSMGFMGLFCLS